MEKQMKQLKMAQLRAELSEKKAAIAEAKWKAEASYATMILGNRDPKSQEVAIAERERELARCESHEQAAVAEYHKAVAILMEKASKEDTEETSNENTATAIHFDGSQASAIRTAVAVFNDSPAVPADCSFDVSVFHHSHKSLGLDDETVVHLVAYNSNQPSGGRTLTLDISECDSPEEQMKKYTEWRKALDYHFAAGKEDDNE